MPKISELPLANKLKEEDYIPIVQDGVTKKVKGTHFVTEEEYSLDAFSPTIAANDKAMYKFGEGDNVDFSESAYDGAYKSAILKGNTLVNILKYTSISTSDAGTYGNTYMHTPTLGDKYLIKIKIKSIAESTSSLPLKIEPFGSANGSTQYFDIKESEYIVGNEIIRVMTAVENQSNEINPSLNYRIREYVSGTFSCDIVMLPYQDGMENWDIPYFEGMQSVRMPVLTTTGKNLWNNYALERGSINHLNGENLNQYTTQTRSKDYIPIVQNTTYIATSYGVDGTTSSDLIRYYDSEKKFIGTSPNEKSTFLRTVFQMDIDNISHIQLEQGAVATPYEPYKTNILSTPSDLELCGIGDVKDELNLLTGELVQNFGSLHFDGSENWNIYNRVGTMAIAKLNLPNLEHNFYVLTSLADKIPVVGQAWTGTKGISLLNQDVYLTVEQSIANTDDDLKNWISSIGGINLIYQLSQSTVKTVDLSGTPFGYKGGHIIKSNAEGSLLPKFEYEVAVSRGAQISQNTSTLIKHDEKITELLKKTAATYINQKAEIAHLLNMSNTLEEVQTIPFIEDDYVNDDCMVDSDMVMDDMELEPEKEIIDNVDTLLINLIYDLIELNDTLGLSEKVELFRQSGLIDKHNYEIIKEKLNPSFKEEDYADINQ